MSESGYMLYNHNHIHTSQMNGDFRCQGPLKFESLVLGKSKREGAYSDRYFTCMATGRTYVQRTLDRDQKRCDNRFKIIYGSVTIIEEKENGKANDKTAEKITKE